MSMLGNYGYQLGWPQATAADVAPSTASADVPRTQELGNPTNVTPATAPTVFGMPPILVTLFGLVGALYIVRAVTVKGA